MKALSQWALILLLALATGREALAATISGKISYAGTSTGAVYVIAVTDTVIGSTPVGMAMLNSPGDYAITGLPNGTYYLVSFMETDSTVGMKATDPWAIYGSSGRLGAVVLAGGSSATGINMVLVDGTLTNPNPFYKTYDAPSQTISLPVTTQAGIGAAIVTDGTFIYLHKQDYSGSSSGKMYKINPSTGEVVATIPLSLESSANRTSWINRMIFHQGSIWATGGYGDPAGLGGKIGVFKFDPTTSNSSNQLPAGPGINPADEFGGLASDGTNFFVGVNLLNVSPSTGFVKFNPALVASVPASPFFTYSENPEYLTYGGGYLWGGLNNTVVKLDPANGTVLGSLNIPKTAAEMYFNNMLWSYSQNSNVLNAYSLQPVGVAKEKNIALPSTFALSQNFPNPFNPSTTIRYALPASSSVSLRIYNILGEQVADLVNSEQSAGWYETKWNANVASGLYFYRIDAVNTSNPNQRFTQLKKMMLLK